MSTSNEIMPLVVIQCITYNHEKYIRDALSGFIMQKTDFPFVVIVHDDASTDGTADIIREYADLYPMIIKPIYEAENQYSKGDGSLKRIMMAAISATGAKYVAMCEGDDYWTDPLKLQKQVDFLESHPEYSLCFHNARTITMDGSIIDNVYHNVGERTYSASEILEHWTIPTASVVYRAGDIDTDPLRFNKKYKYGDNVLFLTAAKYGLLYGFDDYMSVYRMHEGGVTNRAGRIKWVEICIEHLKALDESFSFLLERNLCKKMIARLYIYLVRRHRQVPKKLFTYCFRAFRDAPIQFCHASFTTWVLRRKY